MGKNHRSMSEIIELIVRKHCKENSSMSKIAAEFQCFKKMVYGVIQVQFKTGN